MPSLKKSLVACGFVAACVAAVACSDQLDMGAVKADAGPPGFTGSSNVDASPAEAGDDGPVLACIGTECPAPFATCTTLTRPTYKCGVDLSSDDDNCGACGNVCPDFAPINMKSACVNGSCELQCDQHGATHLWSNCDGLVDDGCEVDLLADAKNCGACGNACAAGVPCVGGQCGCSPGQIVCDGLCVDPQSDLNNCGGCGTVCDVPADACDPPEPNTGYGCIEGQCKKTCSNGTFDCNHDLTESGCGGDGCELFDISTRDNCGGCGVHCADDQQCIVVNPTLDPTEAIEYQCASPSDIPGKSLCAGVYVDLLNDVQNCGACNAACRPPGTSEATLEQAASCNKGLCVYTCEPGFGDCNGDPSDGCETDLRANQENCGACGNACDIAGGQPCIDGKCLMVECDAGGPR